MTWFQDLKATHDVVSLAPRLGLRVGRLNTIAPCPACGVEQRGSEDRRGPIGPTPDRKGWKCHRCSTTGDVVDLACLVKAGKRARDYDAEEWQTLKAWLTSAGVIQATDGARIASVGGVIARASSTPMPSPSAAPTTPTDAISGGAFAWREGRGEEAAERLWSPTGEAVLDYLRKPASEGGRGFTDATIKAFALGMEVVQGEPWLVIPLRDINQRIVNLRFRSVPPAKKTFRMCMGRELPLYGIDRITGKPTDTITLVEGELDVVALYQYGVTVNCVSTTAGAGCFKDEWYDALEPYASFVLCYDNDKAGKEGADAFAKKMGLDRCAITTLPMKDANDCLAHGIPAEAVARALSTAKPLIDVGFRLANEYADELEKLINNPEELIGRPTGSKKLDECIGGLRPGLTVVTGDSGSGKSTFTTWLCWQQARSGYATMVTSFENRPIGLVQKLLRMEMGGDFSRQTPENRRKALDKLGRMPLYLLDHYGNLSPEKMIESIKYAVRRHGVQMVLVDHLGFLITSGDDERAQIENIVRQLAVVAYSLKVQIVLIAHPRTLSSGAERVTMNDLKGASAIKQDASEVLVVVREPPRPNASPPRSWPGAWIYVEKNRSEFGTAGSKALMAFGPLSLVYADIWEDVPEGKTGSMIGLP